MDKWINGHKENLKNKKVCSNLIEIKDYIEVLDIHLNVILHNLMLAKKVKITKRNKMWQVAALVYKSIKIWNINDQIWF